MVLSTSCVDGLSTGFSAWFRFSARSVGGEDLRLNTYLGSIERGAVVFGRQPRTAFQFRPRDPFDSGFDPERPRNASSIPPTVHSRR